jgi:UDP-N-acetylglucosamine 2-epimerase (non-hydrolysing)
VAEGYPADAIAGGFGLVTLHRPSNVDTPDTLAALLDALAAIGARLPLLWPMHPRTRASVERFGLLDKLRVPGLVCLPPQGYLQMVGLMKGATLVLTDSGGVQEETTALGVPCLTLRENTERPVTVEQGTNTLIGRDFGALQAAVDGIVAGGGKRGRLPELWDGHAAGRIAAHLSTWLFAGSVTGVPA